MLANKRFPAAMEKFQNSGTSDPAVDHLAAFGRGALCRRIRRTDRHGLLHHFPAPDDPAQNGIVTDEKRGKEVFYSLNCDCVRKFLECVAEHRKNKTCGE